MGKHTKQREAKIRQLPDGSYVARVTDARTGKRVNIPGSSPESVRNSVALMARVRHDEALGLVDPREKQRLADRAMNGPLTVGRMWKMRLDARTVANRAEEHAGAVICGSVFAASLGPQRNANPNRKRCEPFEGFDPSMLAEELHGAAVAQWWKKARARFSDSTVRSAFFQLRRAVQLVIQQGLLYRIPWDGGFSPPTQAKAERKILTEVAHFGALLGAAAVYDRKQIAGGRYPGRAAFLATLLSTGIRHAEAAGLAWEFVHIDGPDPWIKVLYQAPRGWRDRQAEQRERGRAEDRPGLPTKNRAGREIALTPFAASALTWHREQLQRLGYYRQNGPVFCTENGEWHANGCVFPTHTLAELCEVAGVPRVTVHGLRHTCLSHHMATTGDAANTALFSGHFTKQILLDDYTHPTGSGRMVPQVPLPEFAWDGIPGLPEPARPVARPVPRLLAEGASDRPDFAAAWEEHQSQGGRKLRPDAITDWETRRGQRAARLAEAEGRDVGRARRAARKAARIEWERWLGERFLGYVLEKAEPAPPVVVEAPAPRALPAGVVRREARRVVEAAPPVVVVEASAPRALPAADVRAVWGEVLQDAEPVRPVPTTRATTKKTTWAQRAAEVWREALAELEEMGRPWTHAEQRKAIARAAPRYNVKPEEAETWGQARGLGRAQGIAKGRG